MIRLPTTQSVGKLMLGRLLCLTATSMFSFVALIVFSVPSAISAGLSGQDICTHQAGIVAKAGRPQGNYDPDLKQEAVIVSTSAEFVAALENAEDGAQIVVEDGEYVIGWVKASAKVHIVGRNHWKAVLKAGSLIELAGAGSIVQGIRMEDGMRVQPGGSRDHVIYVKADGVQILDNQFWRVGVNSSVKDKTGIAVEILKSKDVVISNNEFSNMKGIAIKQDDYSIHTIVSHNDFLDSPNYGGVGEVFHIGDALSTGQAQSPYPDDTFAIFENNRIEGWDLEPELISVKSNQNIIRGNFVVGSGESAFVIRMGNKNTVEDNVMVGNNAFPLRISGEENTFKRNHFAGTGGTLFLHNLVFYHETSPNLVTAYWAANRNKITENVFFGYSRLFGSREQYHIVRDAPRGNQFVSNQIFTPDPERFNAQMKFEEYLGFVDNVVKSEGAYPCEIQ